MRKYNYEEIYTRLLSPEIVALLTQIHEYKGEHAKVQEDELTHLIEIARIQSTEASNRIEGIYTSDERLQKIVKDKTTPRNRSEKEIAGYRDVLATIHESYDYIPVKPGMILQLHRNLCKYSGMSIGGNYKTSDNVIEEEDSLGNKYVHFRPVPAWETPEAMDRLCQAYNDLCNNSQYDPLLMIPVFILDFLCIHPFNDAAKAAGWSEEIWDFSGEIPVLKWTTASDAPQDPEDPKEDCGGVCTECGCECTCDEHHSNK